MSENIKWHPYPEEKPPKDGKYKVKRSCITMRGVHVEIDECTSLNGRILGADADKRKVFAWAEFPEPYKGE